MEIIFNKLYYIQDKNSPNEIKYFDEVSLSIPSGTIVGFPSFDLSILGFLLMNVKRPTKGELILDNVVIKRTSHIKYINELKKKIGFICDRDIKFSSKTVKDEIKEYMRNYGYKTKNILKHIIDSLVISGLNDSYLDRDPSTLSYTEMRKLQLACVMSYNPEVIILENFDRGFTFREKENYKKLFLKLKNKFNKTIIIISKDITSMFGIVDKVYVINNGKLIMNDNKKIFYNKELYNFVEMPHIVSFTKYAQELEHDINEYTDLKELIKELYRNVK